jgi:HPt (histidine-containing phosphotransfer) domain-containing protein
MLDWDRIRELREEIGEEDYAEVVELFFEEVESAVERLGQPGTIEQRESDLHFLKGSALNLGFAKLGALCEAGEHKAAQGVIDEHEIADVISAYSESREAFDAARSQ